jgi:hypothetical protein
MSRMCSVALHVIIMEENAYVIDTGRYITWHAHIQLESEV